VGDLASNRSRRDGERVGSVANRDEPAGDGGSHGDLLGSRRSPVVRPHSPKAAVWPRVARGGAMFRPLMSPVRPTAYRSLVCHSRSRVHASALGPGALARDAVTATDAPTGGGNPSQSGR